MAEIKPSGEQKTPIENISLEDKNNNQPVEDTTSKNEKLDKEEMVSISKEELNKIEKKATDFDGIMGKKDRKQFIKDQGGDETPSAIDEEELLKKATDKALETIRAEKKSDDLAKMTVNLGTALNAMQTKYPFLTGEKLAQVSKSFESGEAISVEELKSKLMLTIQQVLPEDYKDSYKREMAKEILEGDANLNLGGIGSGGSGIPNGQAKGLTDEEKTAEKYNKNLPDRFKS